MDQVNGMNQGQDTNVSTPVPSPTPSSAQAPQASDERTFRQSEVNDLVRRTKNEAIETYRRMQTEQPQYVEQKYGDSRPHSTQIPNTQLSELPEDRIRKLAAEEAQRHVESIRQDAFNKSQTDMAQRTVQNFYNKVLPGRDTYPDFDKVALGINLQQYPNVVQLLGDHLDNAADVLYELGKDRSKLIDLEIKARNFPNDILPIAQKLSQSIKDNIAAGKVKTPNEPLSQMRPSNTGTDNGVMSVKDYRMKYRA
jgi:hypothetical protein